MTSPSSVLAAFVAFTIATPVLASPIAHGLPAMAQETAPAPGPVVAQPMPAPVAQPVAQPQPYPPQPQPYYGPQPAPQPYYATEAAPPPYAGPKKRRKGMMVGGWVMLGGSYLFTALTGAIIADGKGVCSEPERCNRVGTYMLIPVAGPFIAIGPSNTAVGSFFLGFAGLTQVAGLIMGIAGTAMYVADGRAQEMAFMNRDGLRLTRRLRLNASPSARYDGGMLGLNYRF